MDTQLQTIGRAPDNALLDMACSGDEDAFNELVRRHMPLVLAVAYSHLNHRETAEELAQEVFLRMHMNLSDLSGVRALAAWLRRVTRNLAVDWLRRSRTRSALVSQVPLDSIAEPADANSGRARDQIQEQQEARLVRDAVERLPVALREAVLLRYAEDLSLTEIAGCLGVFPSSVARRIDKGLALLKEDLGAAFDSGRIRPLSGSSAAVVRASAIAAAFALLDQPARAQLAASAGESAATATGLPLAARIAAAVAGLAVIFSAGFVWHTIARASGTTVHVSGRVLRLPGNVPVEGAAVLMSDARGTNRYQTTTTKPGTFAFAAPRSGEYYFDLPAHQLKAWLPVYDGSSDKRLVMKTGKSALQGTVLYQGMPAVAEVCLIRAGQWKQPVATDEDGFFDYRDLAPGVWTLSLRLMKNKSIRCNRTVTVRSQPLTTGTFHLPTGRVLGKVVDKAGRAVEGAKVTLACSFGGYYPRYSDHPVPDGTGTSAPMNLYPSTVKASELTDMTDAAGRFVLDGIQGKYHGVSARKDGVGIARVEDILIESPADAKPVTLVLSGQGARVEVMPVDGETSKPIMTTTFRIRTPHCVLPDETRRTSEGLVIYDHVPELADEIVIQTPGYTEVIRPLRVREGDVVRLTEVLWGAGGVRVSLATREGEPCPSVPYRMVRTEAPDAAPIEGKSDPRGLIAVNGLRPGKYEVTVSPQDYDPATLPFMVRAGVASSVSHEMK